MGYPPEKEKDNMLIMQLFYKGLKGKTRISTDDLIQKIGVRKPTLWHFRHPFPVQTPDSVRGSPNGTIGNFTNGTIGRTLNDIGIRYHLHYHSRFKVLPMVPMVIPLVPLVEP